MGILDPGTEASFYIHNALATPFRSSRLCHITNHDPRRVHLPCLYRRKSSRCQSVQPLQ